MTINSLWERNYPTIVGLFVGISYYCSDRYKDFGLLTFAPAFKIIANIGFICSVILIIGQILLIGFEKNQRFKKLNDMGVYTTFLSYYQDTLLNFIGIAALSIVNIYAIELWSESKGEGAIIIIFVYILTKTIFSLIRLSLICKRISEINI